MISGRGDPKVENKCGTIGHPCMSVGEYTVYDPKDTSKGYVGVERILVCEHPDQPDEFVTLGDVTNKRCSRIRNPYFKDNPATTDKNENEVAALLKEGGLLDSSKFKGLLRSVYLDKKSKDEAGDPSDQFEWYAYTDMMGEGAATALYGEMPMTGVMPRLFDTEGIELHPSEVIALVDAGIMRAEDAKCGPCPKETGEKDADGKPIYTSGIYHFTMDGQGVRISNPPTDWWATAKAYFGIQSEGKTGILDKLRNTENIPGISEERRQALIKEFERVYMAAAAQKIFQDSMGRTQKISILMTLAFMGVVGYPLFKQIYKKIRGSVQTLRFDQLIDKRLKENPGYDVKGRDVEANTAWKMASKKMGYINIMIDAPTGEGKDVIAEKMIIMKQKGDPAVPKRFRKAPVLKINAAEFQSDTMYRGTVADKVAEIAKKARKGPVIVYMSEIDLVFLSGGTSSGDTESPGKLILDLVDDPEIKRNLMIVGTTSRGKAMLEKYPDLQRRFNWPNVHIFSLTEMVEVLDGPYTKLIERGYGVSVSREMVDTAGRFAEMWYRPEQFEKTGKVPPRFAAMTAILESAAQIAADQGARAMTFEHVLQASAELCPKSVDPSIVGTSYAQSHQSVLEALDTRATLEDIEKRAAEKMQHIKVDGMKGALPATDPFNGLFGGGADGKPPWAYAPAEAFTEADVIRVLRVSDQEAKALMPELRARWHSLPGPMRAELYGDSSKTFLETVKWSMETARSIPRHKVQSHSPFEKPWEEEKKGTEGMKPDKPPVENKGNVGAHTGLPPIEPPARRGGR